MRNIAAEAGVTEPAIYRHFASRADLMGSVFLHCAGMLYDVLAEAAGKAASPAAQLSLMAGAFFDFAFANVEEYAFIVAVHQQQLRHLVPGDVRLPKDLFVEAVRRLQKRNGGAAAPPTLVAGAMVGIVLGSVLFATTGQTKASRKVCREYVTKSVTDLARSSCKRPTLESEEA
jgi:AcrR family transcriptional regulator